MRPPVQYELIGSRRGIRQRAENRRRICLILFNLARPHNSMEPTLSKAPPLQGLSSKASTYVYELFKNHLPNDAVYHSYEHTLETAKAAEMIGREEGLQHEDLLLVTLAAWFHDAGFVDGAAGHEKRSAQIARDFLTAEGIPEDRKSTRLNSSHV